MYDEELEKAMLYYVIFKQEAYLLDENDFVIARHQKIIRAINELKAEKQEVSVFSIRSKIKANQKQVLQYLATLGDYIQIESADSIYNRLMELSKKRKLFKLLQNNMMEVAESENIDILAQKIVKQINEIEQVNEKEKTFTQQFLEVVEKMEKDCNKGMDYSLYTGIQDLDNKICGLHKQELTIIGARPRCWKDYISITDSRIHST